MVPPSFSRSFVLLWLLSVSLGTAVARGAAQSASAAGQDTDVPPLQSELAAHEAALATHPQDRVEQAAAVEVSERLALSARAAGDRDTALKILLHAQSLAPENTRVLYDLGVLEEEMKLYRDSDKTIARALELGSTEPYLLYAAARVKLDLGQLDPAEQQMKAYLKLRPNDASAHYALGRIYHQGVHPEQAAAEFERSVELQPRQTESYFQLGEIELQQGQYDDAIKHYTITVNDDPKHAGAWVGIGIAHFRQKQYEQALPPLEKAVDLEPAYQPGHYYLGLTLARLGRKDESAKQLSEAARLADIDNQKSMQQLHLLQPSNASPQ